MAADFAVFELDNGVVSGLKFVENDPELKGAVTNGEFLAGLGVKTVLAGSIGPHMLTILLDAGIRVFKGAVGTLEDVVNDYNAGMLTEVRTPGEME